MPLNIKNDEVERLAAEVARLTGESKTEAIRRALDERRRRLKAPRRAPAAPGCSASRGQGVGESPPKERGRRLSREEEDAILGYGPGGV